MTSGSLIASLADRAGKSDLEVAIQSLLGPYYAGLDLMSNCAWLCLWSSLGPGAILS